MLRPFQLLLALALVTAARLGAADTPSRAEIATLIDGHHWAAARPLIERLLAADPKDAEALHQLGIVS